MKNIIITLIVFGLVSCAMEEDTRLICDCDFEVFNEETKMGCFSFTDDVDNNSLVFNVSKKKFAWNGNNITGSPDSFIEFGRDTIRYSFEVDKSKKTYKTFDRVNLEFTESTQKFGSVLRNKEVVQDWWKPTTTHYKCRIVEGV